MKFRFHVIGLPHTSLSPKFEACAFSMKLYKFLKMMADLGHETFVYGSENDEIADRCTEAIPCIYAREQEYNFGPFEKDKLFNLDWTGVKPYWKMFNNRIEKELLKRKQPKDFILLVASHLNEQVVDAAGKDIITCEAFIGYDGPSPKHPFRVYESYSHLHRVHGAQKFNSDGSFYEAVIPNYWDHTQYPLCDKKEDYYLYLGRCITRKGITIASQTCEALGAKLIIAGQGARQDGEYVIAEDGGKYRGTYVGCVTGQEKIQLLQRAKAIFVPTVYVEPFGGTACEAQLVGTPAITTDFGAFTETIEHAKTGYRCHTLDQFIWAAKNVGKLDPKYIRDRAVSLWSMDRVRHMYDEYFHMLYDLWGKGFYERHDDRTQLDWLNGR